MNELPCDDESDHGDSGPRRVTDPVVADSRPDYTVVEADRPGQPIIAIEPDPRGDAGADRVRVDAGFLRVRQPNSEFRPADVIAQACLAADRDLRPRANIDGRLCRSFPGSGHHIAGQADSGRFWVGDDDAEIAGRHIVVSQQDFRRPRDDRDAPLAIGARNRVGKPWLGWLLLEIARGQTNPVVLNPRLASTLLDRDPRRDFPPLCWPLCFRPVRRLNRGRGTDLRR